MLKKYDRLSGMTIKGLENILKGFNKNLPVYYAGVKRVDGRHIDYLIPIFNDSNTDSRWVNLFPLHDGKRSISIRMLLNMLGQYDEWKKVMFDGMPIHSVYSQGTMVIMKTHSYT